MMNSSVELCPQIADNAFGPTVHGCRGDFDFTLTFEQAFFSIAPSAVLVLACAGRLPYLVKRERLVEAYAFKWLKVGTIAVFAALQLTLVVLWVTRPSIPARGIGIAASALVFLASICLGLLSPLEHAKSLTPSTILCSYLLLTILFDATILRTLWMFTFDEQVRRVFTTSFSIKVILLLLEAKEKQQFLSNKHDEERSPEEFSGIYGKSLYWWLNSLIRTGFKEVLSPLTLYPLPSGLSANELNERFWNTRNRNAGKRKISLELLDVLKWPILAPVMPRLVLLGFTFCQPLLLQRFLSYLQSPTEHHNANIGYGLIGAYFLTYFGMAVSSAVYWFLTYRSLTMIRGILVTAIYQKTTTIGLTAADNAKAMTLMSTDAERVVRGVMDFHELWSSILQIGIATWLLADQLGAAAVGPVIVCLLAFIATGAGGMITNKYQSAWIGAIQKRIGLTSAALGAIQSIHLSGLAHRIQLAIHNGRLNEVKNARNFWFLGAFTSTIALVPQVISPVVTFAMFTAGSISKNQTLDFSRLFTSLAFLILLTQPLFNLFAGIIDFVAALGCFDRIDGYLAAEPHLDNRQDLNNVDLNEGSQSDHERNSIAIQLQHVSSTWSNADDAIPVLKDVTLTIPSSKLTVVVGPVASGKSTLLKTILSELPSSSGDILLSTKEIAFCDQTPWLFNGTIRENITVFSPFDAVLYQRVIDACALGPDLKALKDGDTTKVGSKGFTLSSGQKQRIALARAVYSRKQIMLFDDILSQLDMNTQRHICVHVLGPDGLLRRDDTTIVFATHTVNVLPFADNVVVMDDGAITEQGHYENLRSGDASYIHKLYHEHGINEDFNSSVEMAPPPNNLDDVTPETDVGITMVAPELPSPSESQKLDPTKARKRMKGDTGIYVYYFSCLGTLLTLAFFFLQVSTAFFTVFPNVWLKWWAESNAKQANLENVRYAGGYAGLQISCLALSGVLTWFSFNIMAQKAGLKLHTTALDAIMHAPMSLFSSVDAGSIITKFSQDFQLVDSSLPLALMCVVINLFVTLGQAGLIASASAWILISFPILATTFYVVQRYYLRTSRQMRLLDLEQKEPLYTQFAESVEGIATLRAFGWESQCISKNHQLVNNSQKPFYLLYMIQKWLSLVLDLIITGLAVVVVGVVVALRNSVNVGFIGLSLSQIISLTSYMKLIILFWTQMETSLGAVSRIKTFSEEAGNENQDTENHTPPALWPAAGGVEICNLSVTYRSGNSPQVALKDVTLSIAPGTKVAICGRTGSGKTTLLLALLKLVDLEGNITIDSLEHATIPRRLLRERIIAVSDEPFMFTGETLRENLNPLHCTVDDELLKTVLREVLLWDVFSGVTLQEEQHATTEQQLTSVDAMPPKDPLDAPISETALSHGQKQLFALARALVRQLAKGPNAGGLIILDEATSRTDKATDAVIQRVVRKLLKSCTLVVIAHRLESVLDFDKVVVLEKGCVVECDAPDVLRNREGSAFSKMLG